MVVHMRVFSSDRSSRCIPNVFRSLPDFKSVCLFSCLFCRLKYICTTSWGSFCDASRCLPVHMMMHWANSLVDYPERKNLLPIYMYVFTAFLLLTQLRPASSEDCQHVLRSAVFSSRTWTYVTWSPGRRSNCVWAYSRWLGRLSWVEWEEGVGGGGEEFGGWFCSVFAQLCLLLFIVAQIEKVHKKLAEKNKPSSPSVSKILLIYSRS